MSLIRINCTLKSTVLMPVSHMAVTDHTAQQDTFAVTDKSLLLSSSLQKIQDNGSPVKVIKRRELVL